jgi:hypothetical protein
MTFSFIQNPTGQAMTDSDLVTSALDQPMSLGSTFWDQAKGGVLESFGLGTAIRESQLPAEAPTTPELMMTPADGGAPVRVPDTPQMRRRITAFEAVNPQSSLQSRQESPQEIQQRQDDAGALSEDAYKASPSFRKDIPWQNGMTQERAAALAEQDDTRKIREFYGQKRPVTAFFGNLAGQAVDPINYIPIAGEAVAGANIARFGRIAGRALTSSLDAAANTALASVATAEPRGQLGDDVSWQSTVSQIAMAALIGGAFGAIHGRFGRATPSELRAEAETKLATLDNVQASRVSLNDALDGMIRDSEVNLSPASTEFVAKAADQELPKVVIARMAREADPEAHQRLETLNRTFDINDAEIRKLQSQTLDNKAYGPTRAAMIQADELASRLQKAEEAIAAAPNDKEKALATARRNTARQELRDHLSTIDDAKVQEIETIDEQLAQRRAVQEPVAAERAQLKQRADQLFTSARDQYWGRRANERTNVSEPTVRAQEDALPGASKSEPIEAFHGTLSDFTRFDERFLGKETGSPDAAAGFFFSSDPYVANSYAIDNPYKDYKILEGKLGKVYARINEAILKLLRGRGLIRKGDVVRAKITFDNPRVIDAAGKEMADDVRAAYLKEAKEAGHDAVLFKDMVDPGFVDSASANKPSDVFVVFDPSKVEIVTRHKSAEEANAWSSNRRAAADAEKVVSSRAGASPAVDNSVPVAAPDPTVTEAVKRVGKPEGTKALAEQYRVNPETGDFPELADIEQLRTEGRLTEEDLAALDDADEIMKTANAYGEALKSFASCVI